MAEKKIAVFGFGKTGRALLEYLLKKGDKQKLMLVNDGFPADEQALAAMIDRGVVFVEAGREMSKLRDADLIILSPGVDARHERFRFLRRQGVRIVSEIEYSSTLIPGRVIAVTGSNGKSTTVSLIHHLLVKCGVRSHLLGNIGHPVIAAVENIRAEDTVVLELSSFQLEEIDKFRADVALLLNVTPDHLDRYADFSAYITAKAAVFRNQRQTDTAILNLDDSRCRELGKKISAGRIFWFSTGQTVTSGIQVRGGDAVLRLNEAEEVVSLAANPLAGVHNLENVLAALLAGHLCGLAADEMAVALGSFQGLPHRMEKVAAANGITYVNDSKATNVDAAFKSIMSFTGPLAVILGGKYKGGDFRLLAPLLARPDAAVILIGQAADTIEGQLKDMGLRLIRASDLAEAVMLANGSLPPRGGVVLLAPACASFDMFSDFAERGRVFATLARKMAQEGRNG